MAGQEFLPCGGPAMPGLAFTAEDVSAIAFERSYHPEPFVQRKMEVLWLKAHGLTHGAIARRAAVSRSSVQRHLRQFVRGGLDAINRPVPLQPQPTKCVTPPPAPAPPPPASRRVTP